MGRHAFWLAAIAFLVADLDVAVADGLTEFYRGKSLRLLIAEPSAADMMADVYRGKSVTFLADVKEGSPYDLTARNAVAEFGKYMPGHPTVVPENMPGAANGRASEYLYNEAPRDGTVMLVASPFIVLAQLLTPSVKYRAEEFSWLGRIAPLTQVGFVSRQKGIASVEATMHRDIVMGAPAPGAPAAMVPWALDRLVGTRFRVVRGYVGDTDLFIAVQRGEIDGMGSVSLNALNQRGWISQKQVDVLYAISNKRLSVLPNVPAVVELARNEHDRSVLRLLTLMSDVGITVITPPRVPEARVAALQQALAKTIEDPDFIEGERSIGIDIDPLSATDIGEIIRRVTDEPTDVIEALKSAIAPLN